MSSEHYATFVHPETGLWVNLIHRSKTVDFTLRGDDTLRTRIKTWFETEAGQRCEIAEAFLDGDSIVIVQVDVITEYLTDGEKRVRLLNSEIGIDF